MRRDGWTDNAAPRRATDTFKLVTCANRGNGRGRCGGQMGTLAKGQVDEMSDNSLD